MNEKGQHVRPDQADIWLGWNAKAERAGSGAQSQAHCILVDVYCELRGAVLGAMVMAGGIGRVEQHDAG